MTDVYSLSMGSSLQWVEGKKSLKTTSYQCLRVASSEECVEVILYLIDNRTLLIHTDNMMVLMYVSELGGTRSPQICQETWDLFMWCLQYRLCLQAMHIL